MYHCGRGPIEGPKMPDQRPDDPYSGAFKGGRVTAAKRTPDEHRARMAEVRETARKTQREQFLLATDPDGTLAATNPDELERRYAEHRRREYSARAARGHASRRARRLALEAAKIAATAVLLAESEVGAA